MILFAFWICPVSHVGDLGNVQPDHQGVVNTDMIDNVASLIGENSVIGRAFVVSILKLQQKQ